MFNLIKAAHEELLRLRADLAEFVARIERGEAVILSEVHAMRDRVEATLGHTSTAMETPAADADAKKNPTAEQDPAPAAEQATGESNPV